MSGQVGTSRHFLFVLLGTGGDVWPALRLAVAAREAGAEVDVAANEHFGNEIRALGLRFHSIGSKEEYRTTVLHPDFWGRRGAERALAEDGYHRLAIPRVLALVNSLREQRPVLICTRTAYGARFAAELYGLTCLSLVYSPQQLVTPERMPYPVNSGVAGRLPSWYWRVGLRVGDWLGLDRILPALNELRRPLGLPPIARLREWLFFGTPALALYPAWFDDLQPLAAAGIRQGDFILRHEDEADVLDGRLADFLAAGPPPVICTLGTGIAHASARYRQVAAVLARMGRRGVFVTPYDDNIQTALGPTILRVNHANFACLFRQASLVIHHGGVGTVAQALRAATPQLVLPFYYDQADNGDRVRRLGVGRLLDAAVPDARVLAEAIEQCSDLPSRPRESLRKRMLEGGGPGACLNALQDLLASRPSRSDSAVLAAEQELFS